MTLELIDCFVFRKEMAPYGGSDPTQLHNLAALMMLAPAHDLSSPAVGLSEGRSGSAMNQMSLFSSGLRSLSEGGRSGGSSISEATRRGPGSVLSSREWGRRSVLRRLEVLLPPSLMLPQVSNGSDWGDLNITLISLYYSP